jgi:Ohr subfamily peroxiredoxin
MTEKVLYTARATAYGGRNGYVSTADGVVGVDLSMPKSMGGPGTRGATTPEDLLAAAFASAFGSAIKFGARQAKLNPKSLKVQATVELLERSPGVGGLKIELAVRMMGLEQAQAEELVRAAESTICPMTNAVRGNVALVVSVVSTSM